MSRAEIRIPTLSSTWFQTARSAAIELRKSLLTSIPTTHRESKRACSSVTPGVYISRPNSKSLVQPELKREAMQEQETSGLERVRTDRQLPGAPRGSQQHSMDGW